MRAILVENLTDTTKDLIITGDDAFHLIKVVRMNLHEMVLLLNGYGLSATAMITQITKKEVVLQVMETKKSLPQNQLTLLCGKPKKNTCEEIIRLSVELGLRAVYFWDSQFAQKNDVSTERCATIIKNAMEQSNNTWKPNIYFLNRLSDSLELVKKMQIQPTVVFHNAKETVSTNTKQLGSELIFAIGPEGGFSKDDLSQLEQYCSTLNYMSLSTPILTSPTAVACATGFLLAH